MNRRHTCAVVLASGLLAHFPGAAWAGDATGWIESMGVLPNGGGYSVAYGVNGDGSVVVGGGNSTAGPRAIRWTRATGPVEVPGSISGAICVSYDGRSIGANNLIFNEGQPPLNIGGEPIAISGDGSRIVAINGPGNLYRVGIGWTTLPGLGSGADITPDARWVLGNSGGGMTRWSETTGTQVLGPGRAGNISADGRIVSGDRSNRLTRWTEGAGFEDLGTFANATALAANGMSDDGSVIVGFSSITPPGSNTRPNPFIWTQQSGIVNLRSFLVGQGIDMSGWSLVDVFDISNDGRTIVGMGFDPDSRLTGFIAHVPTLPAPGAGCFSLLASFTLACRRRRT